MNILKKQLRQLCWLSPLILLAACSSNKTWDKGDGVTMAQVYETQMQQSNQNTLANTRMQLTGIPTASDPNIGITVETNNNFMLLPNPTISLYVYPHLVNGNIPVPGYTTQFTLYTEVHYALPGEVPVLTAQSQGANNVA